MDEFQTVTTEPDVPTDEIDLESIEMEDTDEELSIKATRMARFLWSRRKIILATVAAGIVCSLAYALLLPNVYSSTATLMPPGNSSPYSSMLSALSGAGGELTSAALGLETPGELFVSILQSRNVQNGLIKRFELMSYYHARMLADARSDLKGVTDISEDVKSGVITITVKANSPVMAANLANGYAEELNRVVTEGSTSSARRERLFLEERLRDVKKELDESSKVLSQFSSKSKTLDVGSQAKSMVEQGLKLEAELIEGRSELAALRQTFSADNMRVKAAEARVAELQRQINVMGGVAGNSGDKGNSGNSLYPSAAELPALGLTYADLERKVRVDEELWAALTKQYEAAKVDEVKEIPTVRILDVGGIPERKSAPTRWLIMVFGTFLSFVIGCLAVLGHEQWKEMDPKSEPKKLILEVVRAVLQFKQRRVRA